MFDGLPVLPQVEKCLCMLSDTDHHWRRDPGPSGPFAWPKWQFKCS